MLSLEPVLKDFLLIPIFSSSIGRSSTYYILLLRNGPLPKAQNFAICQQHKTNMSPTAFLLKLDSRCKLNQTLSVMIEVR